MEIPTQPSLQPELVSEERRVALQNAANLDGATASHHFKVLGEQLYISVAQIDGVVNLVDAIDESGLQGVFTLIQKGDREAVDQIRKELLERADGLLDTARDIEADGSPAKTLARYEAEGRIEPTPNITPLFANPEPLISDRDDLLPTAYRTKPDEDDDMSELERRVRENYDEFLDAHNQMEGRGRLANKTIRTLAVLGIGALTTEQVPILYRNGLLYMRNYAARLEAAKPGEEPLPKGKLQRHLYRLHETNPEAYAQQISQINRAIEELDAQLINPADQEHRQTA